MKTLLREFRGLLRGEVVEIDGKACQMIHSEGFAPARPIHVPLLGAAAGGRGGGCDGDPVCGNRFGNPPKLHDSAEAAGFV